MTYDDLTVTWTEPALAVLGRLTAERDLARDFAAAAEAENARLIETVADLHAQIGLMEMELANGDWPT